MILLLLLVPPAWYGLAGAQAATRDPIQLLVEYRNLVETYRRDGVDGAEAHLKKADAERVGGAIALLEKTRRLDPLLLDTRVGRPELGGWSMPLVAAAVLLHADVFLHRAKKGSVDFQHLNFAGRLLRLYTGSEADPAFKVRATLAVAWMRQITGDLAELRRQLAAARNEFFSDPGIAMAEGCLEEAAASPRAVHQASVRRALARAVAHYERALSLDPQFAEARMRLGFALLRLGRADDAYRELHRAENDAREARVAYLARLFLGSLHEHTGRLGDAIAAYRDARASGPRCQVAAVALSHALYRAGDRIGAADMAREAGASDPAACEDPWWSYDYGQAWKIDVTMEALRREIPR
jgi:hypothetical protein